MSDRIKTKEDEYFNHCKFLNTPNLGRYCNKEFLKNNNICEGYMLGRVPLPKECKEEVK